MDAPVTNIENDQPDFISEVVQKQFRKYMQELERKSDKFIKREHLTEFINGFIEEKLPSCLNAQMQRKPIPTFKKSPASGDSKPELEMNLNRLDNGNTYLKEDVALLEQRINNLEDCLDMLLQLKNPKSPRIDKSEKIKNESMNSFVVKSPQSGTAPVQQTNPKINQSQYDDLYYEWRQNKLNQTSFKNVHDKAAQMISPKDCKVNGIQKCSNSMNQCLKPHHIFD